MARKRKRYSAEQRKKRREIRNAKKKPELRVSDHAIMRYFERVMGYDIDEIKAEIINQEVVSQVRVLGKSGRFSNGRFHVVMEDGVVATVY